MSKNKIVYLVIFTFLSMTLSGCSFFSSTDDTSEMVYPPGIITPTPTNIINELEDEEENEETESDLEPTPEVSVTPEPDLEVSGTPSPTITPTPTDTAEEGDYRININSALVSETAGGIEVKVEGIYTDNCTVGKYDWEIQGNQIMIEIGQPDDTKTDCQESTKPYTATIPVNYSFKPGQEYTVVANGFESEPFSIE